MVGIFNIIEQPGSVAISIKIKERTHRQDIRTLTYRKIITDNNTIHKKYFLRKHGKFEV